MKVLLAICMMVFASFALAAENNAAPPSVGGVVVVGKVLEVKIVDNYTYLRLMTNEGEIWVAIVNAKAKKGETITIEKAMLMENFESKALKRSFKKILFGTLGGAGNAAASAPATGSSLSMYTSKKKLEKINEAPVLKASAANAMTVEEVLTRVAELKGKPVVVRGKVVKYNAEIMGVNWIHLQDGSGSEADGSNDILVTSNGTAKVGDVVTVEGIVATDKDFGAGYSYKVLIEKATVQKQ